MTRELAHWPLVACAYDQSMDLEGYQAQLDDWNVWLARGEPFALLRIFRTEASLQHPDGSALLVKQWMQDTAPRIPQALVAMATVVPESAYEKLKKFKTEKIFGVPGEVFTDPEQALAWLRAEVQRLAGLELAEVDLQAL